MSNRMLNVESNLVVDILVVYLFVVVGLGLALNAAYTRCW